MKRAIGAVLLAGAYLFLCLLIVGVGAGAKDYLQNGYSLPLPKLTGRPV